jgi:hypothetical protein
MITSRGWDNDIHFNVYKFTDNGTLNITEKYNGIKDEYLKMAEKNIRYEDVIDKSLEIQ